MQSDPHVMQHLRRLDAEVAALRAQVAVLAGRRKFTPAEAERALSAYAEARGLQPGGAVDFLSREVVDAAALAATRAKPLGQRLGALVDASPDGVALLGPFAVARLASGRRDGALWQLRRLW